jgi:hypothetical protein
MRDPVPAADLVEQHLAPRRAVTAEPIGELFAIEFLTDVKLRWGS